MLLQKERELIVEYGKKLITSGLTTGTGGNISIRHPEKELFAISPSGIDYFKTEPEDVVVIDFEGDIVDGDKKPSSEVDMHRILYLDGSSHSAVVHTHSMYSTILATLGMELPAVNYYIAIAGGDNVRVAPYAAFGTYELAENARDAMEDRNACFLANHGLLTASYSIEQAFSIAEEVERMAEIYYKSSLLAEPNILNANQVEEMLERFQTYGQKK